MDLVQARPGIGETTTGFAVEPVEKTPLHHFLPGASVFSFDSNEFTVKDVIEAAGREQCTAVATDLTALCADAAALTAAGLRTIGRTDGHFDDADKFCAVDAAVVCLNGADEATLAGLGAAWRSTSVWIEVTTHLVPGENDGDEALSELCLALVRHLGTDVPLHLRTHTPDGTAPDTMRTPPATLRRARRIALDHGLRFVYTMNPQDLAGQLTRCGECGDAVITRDWYRITDYRLTDEGECRLCGARLPGIFKGSSQ